MGLDQETNQLLPFYSSVADIVKNLKTPDARQHVLEKLYENFFQTAMKKSADRLGIVYTPRQIVDFILRSADYILQQKLGKRLSDSGVEILDPFSGTGQFIVRLINSDLIDEADLRHKYSEEIHTNEIQLLAYYIGCIHVEQAFHQRCQSADPAAGYVSYKKAVLCDTFSMETTSFSGGLFGGNNARAAQQSNSDIKVIIGNPPYSAGQTLAKEDNQNIRHQAVDELIQNTYAMRSTAKLKRALYDSYIKAFRWASKRLTGCGVIGFITPASWLTKKFADGMRHCIFEEFDAVYIVNCRGDIRRGMLDPVYRKKEGGNVFGSGCQSPIAITFLVRTGKREEKDGQCRIEYYELSEELSTQEKLNELEVLGSIANMSEYSVIHPNVEGDWLDKRTASFSKYMPLGMRNSVNNDMSRRIFRLHSSGVTTGIDGWLTEYTIDRCIRRSGELLREYKNEKKLFRTGGEPKKFRQEHMLKNIVQDRKFIHDESKVFEMAYRPFVSRLIYFEHGLCNAKYKTQKMFPNRLVRNPTITVPGAGANARFSVLMVDRLPDRHHLEGCQCFPRHTFQLSGDSGELIDISVSQGRDMQDNITNQCQQEFHAHYRDASISKDDIFYYVYGVLSSSEYQQKYSADLKRLLPHVPLCSDFEEFKSAGERMAKLHLNYSCCEEYPLDVEQQYGGEMSACERDVMYQIRFIKNKSGVEIPGVVKILGIPPKAYLWAISGKSPLEWVINMFKNRRDRATGYMFNPDEAYKDVPDLISKIKHITYVCVETASIIEGMPHLNEAPVAPRR